MKKAFVAVLLIVTALPAFAQWNPRPRPYPRPYPQPYPPYRSCQVVAVDYYNRVLARFYGQTDHRGMCRSALHQCNYEIRRRGWYGARCTQLLNRW
jgi:hypothetical protein